MTDFPAVVYLKRKNPVADADISEREVSDCQNTNISKTASYKRPPRYRKREKQESLKNLFEVLSNSVMKKLDKIEEKLDTLSENSDVLEEKVKVLSCYLNSSDDGTYEASESSTVYKRLKNWPALPVKAKTTEIVLNAKDDFPKGSWLGYENNPEMRVRCNISPKKLQEINRRCITPEKMALALLDQLFAKEVQACSNISGLGKHRKKQLNPLLIYGHLMYRFDIKEEEWTKAKIHMDSKCRSEFRKKIKRARTENSDALNSIGTTSPDNCT